MPDDSTRSVATEAERADTPSRETEEIFRALSVCSPVGIMVTDPDGRCTYVNPRGRAILGSNSLMAVLGYKWLRAVHPAERAQVAEQWAACAQGGREFQRDVRLQRKTGNSGWARIQSAAMTSDAGQFLGWVVSLDDITERRRAEETLRTKEEHFRTLIENGTDVITIVNADGRVRYASPSVERVLGYRPEEMTGQNAFALVHADDRTEVLRIFREGVQQPWSTAAAEYRYQHKDGSWRVIESIGRNLLQQETIHGVIITSRDITDRRQAEEQLRLRGTALQSAANAMMIARPDGTIEWVNPAFTQMTGYAAAEAVGQNPRLLKSGNHDAAFYRQLWQTITAGQPWHGEMTNRRKDGSLYTEEMTITPVRDHQGRLQHFIAIKQDITERKRLEQQYRQAQKMEVMGRLAGGVAHDFNNLLTAILGYNDLLLRRLPDGDPLLAHAEEVRKAAERATGLTRQLLSFSRQQVRQPVALDLGALVADMEKMLARVIGEDIALRTPRAPALPCVKADRSQVEQLILNLAVNARDAMPTGGTLTIETGVVAAVPSAASGQAPGGNLLTSAAGTAAATPEAGAYVTLTVTDTGAGMTDEVKTHLFEPFFTTKPEGKGTGLGLATCHGIVEQNGGQIAVRSQPGAGTTFTVYLPAVTEKPAATPPPTAEPAASHRGTETVLIAEDEPALRQLASLLLRQQGYDVLEAADGLEALRLATQRRDGPIHILVADVIMPGMSGDELADQFQRVHPEAKILYCSGHSHEAIARRGVLDPGVELLSKPYTPALLTRRIREVLDRPRAP